MDTHDEEVAAQVIKDLLFLIPEEKRAAALALATKLEAEQRDEPEMVCAADVDFINSPYVRHWYDIMQFKSRLVYTFVRDITNNHSPEDASCLLFQWPLDQYLDRLARAEA
jgi:hypothetical protein